MAKKDLAYLISQALEEYDPECSYKDFAKAVSEVIKKDYGQHLKNHFITKLRHELNKK